jgi:hypothetical protein
MADAIERRLRRLEDLEEIRHLKARYCHFSDRGYEGAGDSPAEIAALFADDGAWGDARGREAIEQLFEGFRANLPLAVHVAANPTIEVDADRATARWWGVIATTAAGGEALWIAGVYDDELVRTAEGWRIARLRFTSAVRAPQTGGRGAS